MRLRPRRQARVESRQARSPAAPADPAEAELDPRAESPPVDHYDDLAAEEIISLLGSLEPDDLDTLLSYEREHRGRDAVAGAIESVLARVAGSTHRSLTRPEQGRFGARPVAWTQGRCETDRCVPTLFVAPGSSMGDPSMRNRSFIAVTIALTILIAVPVAVYAYDSSNEDRIANGVTIGGVSVGGLSAAEARPKLQRELAAPLEKPISVTHGKRTFNLSSEDAEVRADVGGMVDEAVAASRAGNIFGRAFRDVTGGEEDARVEPRVSYSKAAVAGLGPASARASTAPPRTPRSTFRRSPRSRSGTAGRSTLRSWSQTSP